MSGFLEALWRYLLLASPYLMFGLFISGLIYEFIRPEKIKKFLGKGTFAEVIKAALIGIPLPMCSCSVIPTAALLRRSGASTGATSAFLISTPETGVDSISITYGLMDLPMSIIRPLSAFISAITAGFLNKVFNSFDFKENNSDQSSSCCEKKDLPKKEKSIFIKFRDGIYFSFTDLLEDMSFWLIIGLICGASIDYFLPSDFFTSYSPYMNKLIILTVSIPLYICASASTPIAASLFLKGMTPGAVLILLLVGPATNISNIMVMQKYIGKKGILIQLVSIVSVALLFSWLVDILYYGGIFELNWKIKEFAEHSHSEITLFHQVLTYLFVVLLFVAFIKAEILPMIRKFNRNK